MGAAGWQIKGLLVFQLWRSTGGTRQERGQRGDYYYYQSLRAQTVRGGTTKCLETLAFPRVGGWVGWGVRGVVGQVARSSPLTDWLGQRGAGKLAPCHSLHQHSGMLLLSSAKPSTNTTAGGRILSLTLCWVFVKRCREVVSASRVKPVAGECVSICHTMTPNVSTNARTKCWSEYRGKAQILQFREKDKGFGIVSELYLKMVSPDYIHFQIFYETMRNSNCNCKQTIDL